MNIHAELIESNMVKKKLENYIKINETELGTHIKDIKQSFTN